MSAQPDLFATPPRTPADIAAELWLDWPEWAGPEVGGRGQVESLMSVSLEDGVARFWYMAPVRLVERRGEQWVGIVDYDRDSHPTLAARDNGKRRLLDAEQIGPPTQLLLAARRAARG